MSRGFTIVEVLVVIVVLTILTTIITGSYLQYQMRAEDSEAQSLAASVSSSAERYFNRVGEYPSAAQLFGGTPNGSLPANYSATKSLLELASSALSSNTVKLLPCANSTSTTCVPATPDKTKVYYLTKQDSDGTSVRSYTIQSKPSGGINCSYTFVSGEVIRSAYLIAYWSNQSDIWQVVRSLNGTITTSSTANCPFRAL